MISPFSTVTFPLVPPLTQATQSRLTFFFFHFVSIFHSVLLDLNRLFWWTSCLVLSVFLRYLDLFSFLFSFFFYFSFFREYFPGRGFRSIVSRPRMVSGNYPGPVLYPSHSPRRFCAVESKRRRSVSCHNRSISRWFQQRAGRRTATDDLPKVHHAFTPVTLTASREKLSFTRSRCIESCLVQFGVALLVKFHKKSAQDAQDIKMFLRMRTELARQRCSV